MTDGAMKPPAPEPGIPIAYYLANHPETAVELACAHCNNRKVVPFAEMVEQLKARGLGDENSGILEIGPMMKAPCMRCEGVRWVSRPWWPPRR